VILDGIAVIVPPEACKDPQIGNCPGGVVLSGGGITRLVLANMEVSSPSFGVGCAASGRVELILKRIRLATSRNGLIWTCDAASAAVEVHDSEISGNLAGIGIGSYEGPGSRSWKVKISNTIFSGNQAGIVISAFKESLSLVVEHSQFFGNGSGIFADFLQGFHLEIRDSLIQAGDYGINFGGFPPPIGLDYKNILMRMVNSQVLENRVVGVVLGSPEGTEGIELINNEIRGNGTGVRIMGTGGKVALYTNSIENNQLWGVALDNYKECLQRGIPRFIGGQDPKLEGKDNIIKNNGRGDLCPEEYNWPPGFVKASETP